MDKYYVYICDYCERDKRVIEITKEEYDILFPYSMILSDGDSEIPDNISEIIFDNAEDTITDRDPVDLRRSEIENWDFTNTITISIC